MSNDINFLKIKLVFLLFLLFFSKTSSFCQNSNKYLRFLDSADVHVGRNSKKTQLFLDSIPKPVEHHIKGFVGQYYITQGHIYGYRDEDAKAFQSFLTALKYAEIEKEYMVAGDANVQLFRNVSAESNDSLSYRFLNKAKYYFELCDYKYGLYEVELLEAHSKSYSGNLTASNQILLKGISKYKKVINEDAYLYLDAVAELTFNYIKLDSIDKARYYFKEFVKHKNNPSITLVNLNDFIGALNINFAEYFLKKQHLDSSYYYLKQSEKYLKFFDDSYIILYYNLCIDLNNKNKNIELSKTYLDSLRLYENKLINNNINASIEIKDSIDKVETKLNTESKESSFNKFLVITLALISVLLSAVYFIFYRKSRVKLKDASDEVEKLTYIKSSNEKLAVKVQGLEGFINNLKHEIKEISTLDPSSQRQKIKEFYTNLHFNSSTLLDKSYNHLELVNDLNVDFFKSIQQKYPTLKSSEIIICYYLFLGFSNKEIAVFLNTSIRAIESKRYRISKKINLDTNETSLIACLNEAF